jgi:uncharacterized protein
MPHIAPCFGDLQARVGASASAAPSDSVPRYKAAGLTLPLAALGDEEGAALKAGLPPVVDAHVHLFPPRLFEAIWRWFETHGWPIRYKLHAEETIAFLLSRGISHIVALHYAHKPGLARFMNQFMAEIAAKYPQVTGLATVFPGETDTGAILRDAFASGLRGVKLHCHVQCFAADDAKLGDVYDACVAADLPLVMHAGREPSAAAYKVDTYAVCNVARTREVLKSYPRLRLVVPHLGADEFLGYQELLEQHDNLWLDTTMMLGHYFAMEPPTSLLTSRPDRILYGTDFPNLPYAWDRELAHLESHGFTDASLPLVLGENARAVFGIRA